MKQWPYFPSKKKRIWTSRSHSMIDTSMKLDNNDTASCLKTVFKFLQMLKFPYSSELQLQDDLTKGL